MIDAAVRLLVDSIDEVAPDALAFAVSNIRVTDVVAEASRLAIAEVGGDVHEYRSLSIGALYQIWPTQPEFQADLLRHLAGLGAVMFPPESATRAHLDEGIDGEELLLLTLREAWIHSRSDPVFRLLLAAYPRMADPQIRTMLSDGYSRFVDAVESGWTLSLQRSGRRLRPPYTLTHLARSVAAVIEGFSLQWLADPGALADPEAEANNDLAVRAIVVVVDSFTERLEIADG